MYVWLEMQTHFTIVIGGNSQNDIVQRLSLAFKNKLYVSERQYDFRGKGQGEIYIKSDCNDCNANSYIFLM